MAGWISKAAQSRPHFYYRSGLWPGVSKRDADRIFQPFYRTHSRITDGVTGTGIGLSIARDLARLHGGDLTLVPTDQGACFKIELHTPVRPSMKILIAEDDQYIREGLRDLLEAEGYQTVLAVDGAEAVTKYHEESPHFVLLDIMMPGKDGYTVCREIRGHSSQVPVIFLSAKSEEIDRVIGLELGADDYIMKPFGTREVVARIRAVTRRCLATQSPEGKARVLKLGDSGSLSRRVAGQKRGAPDRSQSQGREYSRAAARQPGQGGGPQHPVRPLLGAKLPAQQPHPRSTHFQTPQADRKGSAKPRNHPHRSRRRLPLRLLTNLPLDPGLFLPLPRRGLQKCKKMKCGEKLHYPAHNRAIPGSNPGGSPAFCAWIKFQVLNEELAPHNTQSTHCTSKLTFAERPWSSMTRTLWCPAVAFQIKGLSVLDFPRNSLSTYHE